MATPKATHEVIRTIPGTNLKPGDLVDASGWRTAEKLVRSRYIKPLVDVAALQARVDELEAENRALKGRAAPRRG